MILRKGITPSTKGNFKSEKGVMNKEIIHKLQVSKVNEGKKTYEFIGSSEVVDRDGDIVLLDGIDYKNFEKNPVVLWGHDYGKLPIGKVISVIHDSGNKVAKFEIEFADTPFAKEVEQLVDGGYLHATSIGFMVKDWDYDDDVDAFVFTKTELLEISIVTVPANQDAVVTESEEKGIEETAKSKSLSAEDIASIATQVAEILKPKEDEGAALDGNITEGVLEATQEESSEPAEKADEEASEDEKSEDTAANEPLEAILAALQDLKETLVPKDPEDIKDDTEGSAETSENDESPENTGDSEDETDNRSEKEEVEESPEVTDLNELNEDDVFVIIGGN